MQMKKSSEVSISHLTAKEVNKVDGAKAVDRGQCMPGSDVTASKCTRAGVAAAIEDAGRIPLD